MNKPKKTLKLHRNHAHHNMRDHVQTSLHPMTRCHHRKVTNRLSILIRISFSMNRIQIPKHLTNKARKIRNRNKLISIIKTLKID